MSRILVIDDEDVIRVLVMEILEAAGHDVVGAEDAERALLLLDDDFDLVVSDVVMPGLSGLELLEAVRTRRASLPVVLVTGAGTYETLSQALMRGAAGLVTKPFAHADLQAAVAHALERASRSRDELREQLLAPTLASALANAIEARDSYLHGHCERLAALAVRIAEDLGLTHDDVEAVRLGAILHDVGKIGIPDRVLLKPSALDDEERRIVETHPEIGDKLLEPLDLLASARPVVRHHHERWDGTGYPDRLAGNDIPLIARIVSVADSIEVMSARQLYRRPLSPDGVVAELRDGSGSQWDPRIVEIALRLIDTGELVLSTDGLHLLTPTPGEPVTAPHAVLLVEDDEQDARALTGALERALPGAVVVRSRTVADATEFANGAEWSLAVVDYLLPDGSGLRVLDALHAAHAATPVVMLTGNGAEDTAIEAFRHGASDYVVKGGPYLEALTSRVRGLVMARAASPVLSEVNR
ncbi:MAG TPA: response regulator [Gaiellaceae bacterium]|nr:response regulator [Gaiellaceae bacterium]